MCGSVLSKMVAGLVVIVGNFPTTLLACLFMELSLDLLPNYPVKMPVFASSVITNASFVYLIVWFRNNFQLNLLESRS